jgi:hypothetical protein
MRYYTKFSLICLKKPALWASSALPYSRSNLHDDWVPNLANHLFLPDRARRSDQPS